MSTPPRRAIPVLLATLLLAPAAARAATTLQSDPINGALLGAPGATVGWGFTITNDTDFLVVTSASFVPSSSLGTFTDFVAQFNFFVVGPAPESTPVTQAFDNTLQKGIGSFTISVLALPGNSASGQIVLTYDLFSVSPNDPTFDPVSHTLSTDNLLTADASVAVPAPDLTLTKSHTGDFVQGQNGALYLITVTNSGTAPTSGTVTVADALPAGLTATSFGGTGWTCLPLPALSCSRSDPLPPSTAYLPITLIVTVAWDAPVSLVNSATVSGGAEVETANDGANDPTDITAVIPAMSHAGLVLICTLLALLGLAALRR